jgi:hypothetical protein
MIQEEQLKQSCQNDKDILERKMNQPVAIKYRATQFSRIYLGILNPCSSLSIRGRFSFLCGFAFRNFLFNLPV